MALEPVLNFKATLEEFEIKIVASSHSSLTDFVNSLAIPIARWNVPSYIEMKFCVKFF